MRMTVTVSVGTTSKPVPKAHVSTCPRKRADVVLALTMVSKRSIDSAVQAYHRNKP